jgi:hypothetical protein
VARNYHRAEHAQKEAKKWVSDLRTGLRKRNKQKTCDFELSFEKQNCSECRSPAAASFLKFVSENNTFLILENRRKTRHCMLSAFFVLSVENVGANLKKNEKRKMKVMNQKLKSKKF